jgi:hypothetical protein
MKFRFSIRDVLWLMVVVAVAVGMTVAWRKDHAEQLRLYVTYQDSCVNRIVELEKELNLLKATRP